VRAGRRTWLWLVLLALPLAAAAWLGNGGDEGGDWVAVGRGNLRVVVELTGTLRSRDSAVISPPEAPEVWDYKIAWLAIEGSVVEAGRPVIRFDTAELERKLEQKEAERDQAASEIAKRRADEATRRSNARLALAEAQAALRMAELQLAVPAELMASSELATARLDAELAAARVLHQEREEAAASRAAQAELAMLEETRRRAEIRVAQLQRAIAAMQVTASRTGTLILVGNWRNEKKKTGDSCWRGERIAEIADLTRMMAVGEVEEADAGRVTVGQPVALTLDAHPDVRFAGTVAAMGSTVQQRSWRDPLKVVKIDIELASTDPERMRPGMRFRGEVELERVEGVLTVPPEAVAHGARGPTVRRRTLTGSEDVVVEVGRRGVDAVEIAAGLAEGDRIARRYAPGGGSG